MRRVCIFLCEEAPKKKPTNFLPGLALYLIPGNVILKRKKQEKDLDAMDMQVNLSQLPKAKEITEVRILRALPPDRERILSWVRERFGPGWAGECAVALSAQPGTCFVAQRAGQIVGFACYDATARGFFGPIGVEKDQRGSGIGRELLIRCLGAMEEAGYGYAVIGWCDEAAAFYSRTVGAVPIAGSEPQNSVYRRMTLFSKTKEKEQTHD